MELIHTCYRITDIDRSVAFYTALGFEERHRMPIREEAINVFMGLPGDGDRLELTYNFGVDSYESAPATATSRSRSTTSTRPWNGSLHRGSSRSGPSTRCARGVPSSPSSAIRTATGSS